MNLPQFEKCASKDELRSAMMHVALFKDYTVCTNAHVLAWQKNEYPSELQSFINEENAVFIPAEQYKKISGKEIDFLDVDKHSLVFRDTKKGSKIFVEYTTEKRRPFGRYPQWKQVLPVDIDCNGGSPEEPTAISAIGMDINYLQAVKECFKWPRFRFDFFGERKAILLTEEGPDKRSWTERGAIVMPVVLEEITNWI